MHILQSIWRGLDWSVLTNLLLSVVPALICITLHELAHGYVAYRLGDDTAKRAGRLTLNPLRHIDIMGLLMMIVFKFGWAKPVPVNMWKFKNPKKGMAITAAAGPIANLLIALVFLLPVRFCSLCSTGPPLAELAAGDAVYHGISQRRAGHLQYHPHPAAGRLKGALLLHLGPVVHQAHVL